MLVLESEIASLRTSSAATQAELQAQLHAAQLELSQRAGEVETLRARLSAYAFTGGDRPIPVFLIVGITALAAVLVLIVLLIVVRLVL